MNDIYNTFLPKGFSTVNSYLFVSNPEELISFLKEAFFAEELSRTVVKSSGDIANCILRIGHSSIMISQARGEFEGMRGANYLFVEDVDLMYNRAIENGATNVFAPADMDYRDRQAGIVDPAGNYWWISMRLVHSNYED